MSTLLFFLKRIIVSLLQDYSTLKLKLEAEHWQEACEEAKRKVKELEEDLRESARREERIKLEGLHQMQEIKGELTTTRAKVKERERKRVRGREEGRKGERQGE